MPPTRGTSDDGTDEANAAQPGMWWTFAGYLCPMLAIVAACLIGEEDTWSSFGLKLAKLGSLPSLVTLFVTFVKHYRLYSVPKKGAPFCGSDELVCDGEDVVRLGATSYLARQMLIWSDSPVARVGALVVDSCARRSGTLTLALLWGVVAAIWFYAAAAIAVKSGSLDENTACYLTDERKDELGQFLDSVCCDERPCNSSKFAVLCGIGMGLLFFPNSVVVFTTAATVKQVASCSLTTLVYVVGSCKVATQIGAQAGLLAVTTVVFPVFLVSLLWGNFALLFLSPSAYAISKRRGEDEWELLLTTVLHRGIGQIVLGITDKGLETGLDSLPLRRRNMWSPLVASLVRGHAVRKKLVGEVEMAMVVGMFHRDWCGVPPPTDLIRDGDYIRPVYGGEMGTKHFSVASVSRRLVQVGLYPHKAGTNSTNPVLGNEEILPVFYEKETPFGKSMPPLSLLCVQPFRHARCRERRHTGSGYCKSVGPPPVTLEEALLGLFSGQLVCWQCMRWLGHAGVGGEPPAWTTAFVFCLFNLFGFQRFEYLWVYRAFPLVVKRFITENNSVVSFLWFALAVCIFEVRESSKTPLYCVMSLYVVSLWEVRRREWRNWKKDPCWRWGVEGGCSEEATTLKEGYGHQKEEVARLELEEELGEKSGVPVGMYRATAVGPPENKDSAVWTKGSSTMLRACDKLSTRTVRALSA